MNPKKSAKIKQKDRLRHVEEVASQIDIVDVCMLTSKCQRPANPDKLAKQANAQHHTEVHYDSSNRCIRVIAQFRFEVLDADVNQNTENALLVEASYGLLYTLKNDQGVNYEKAKAFGEVNGVYNAWPFWREYVYTTLARMGLPPVTLPVFRIDDSM